MPSPLDRVRSALLDEGLQEALLRAATNNQVKVEALLRERPELTEAARRARRAKEEAIARLEELIDEAM
ncbi:MAG: hypothetical protein F7B18_02365, partial [Desulfurococcales archaeon]|nr:hypothetical protein [Desulfurococcales archaeon]